MSPLSLRCSRTKGTPSASLSPPLRRFLSTVALAVATRGGTTRAVTLQRCFQYESMCTSPLPELQTIEASPLSLRCSRTKVAPSSSLSPPPRRFLSTVRWPLRRAEGCAVTDTASPTVLSVRAPLLYQSLTRGIPFVFEVLKDKGDTFCKLVATTLGASSVQTTVRWPRRRCDARGGRSPREQGPRRRRGTAPSAFQ